jgi:cation-transporting ATPase E
LNIFLGVLVLTTGQIKNLTFLFTIIANSIIGIIQELKVKSLVDKLSVITASKANVIRNGEKRQIALDELVLDDVMVLESGDQIGADCIVLEAQGIEVNESMITGESVAVKKHQGDEMLSGSYLVAGSGIARVIHVGSENYATILASQAKNKKRATSEMQDAIKRIIKLVGFLIIPVGILLFLSQRAIEGTTMSDAIVHTVSGVIGMIPEGLVLLTSVSFILGVGRLARKQALVQEMEAIEALARVNVLCLDKTGTITTGELEVVEVVPCGRMEEAQIRSVMCELTYAFNDVNPTQQALMHYFEKTARWQTDDLIPFSSARKYRAVSFAGHGAYVLGAPEFIMKEDTELLAKSESYAMQGYRVLLLAETDSISSEHGTIGHPKAAAFIVISDCVREEAPSTFAYFEAQNVAIKVISGDNPATVSQIALKAGLKNGDKYIDATTLPENFAELKKLVKDYTVFGRVTPEQKQRIIKAYQANKSIVGMVGDGVNDVLALKDADCGIAMAAGSDAAKQVAHIVLMDSDFVHMKDIVREGRMIISNIERVSALYLTKTIYSVLLSIIFILLGRSYPFEPIHLTLISTVAIGIPSFFLALEQTETVTSSGFLKHVLRISLPGALTMVLNMLIIQWIATVFGFSSDMTATYNLIVAGMVSLMVLLKVCSPMNKIRGVLCYAMTFIFAACVIFLPDLFSINRVFCWRMVFIVPIIMITYYSMKVLSAIVHFLLRKHI